VPSEINSQNKNYGCIWIDITIAKNVVDERGVELHSGLAVSLEFTAVIASGTSLLRTVFLPFLTQKTTAEHSLYRAE
jgi:hypothetical protein